MIEGIDKRDWNSLTENQQQVFRYINNKRDEKRLEDITLKEIGRNTGYSVNSVNAISKAKDKYKEMVGVDGGDSENVEERDNTDEKGGKSDKGILERIRENDGKEPSKKGNKGDNSDGKMKKDENHSQTKEQAEKPDVKETEGNKVLGRDENKPDGYTSMFEDDKSVEDVVKEPEDDKEVERRENVVEDIEENTDDSGGVMDNKELVADLIGYPFDQIQETSDYDGWALTEEEKNVNAELLVRYCRENNLDVSTGVMLIVTATSTLAKKYMGYQKFLEENEDTQMKDKGHKESEKEDKDVAEETSDKVEEMTDGMGNEGDESRGNEQEEQEDAFEQL